MAQNQKAKQENYQPIVSQKEFYKFFSNDEEQIKHNDYLKQLVLENNTITELTETEELELESIIKKTNLEEYRKEQINKQEKERLKT